MKKLTGGIIIVIMVASLLSMTGCKRIQGEYYIEYITSLASRNLTRNLTYFYVEASVASTNQVSGKIIDWYAKVYTAEDEEILEITKDNYEALGFNLVAQRTPIQGFYSGSLAVITDPAVPGDMFAGKTPAKVLVRVYLQDMNDYQSEAAFVGSVGFEEVTD